MQRTARHALAFGVRIKADVFIRLLPNSPSALKRPSSAETMVRYIRGSIPRALPRSLEEDKIRSHRNPSFSPNALVLRSGLLLLLEASHSPPHSAPRLLPLPQLNKHSRSHMRGRKEARAVRANMWKHTMLRNDTSCSRSRCVSGLGRRLARAENEDWRNPALHHLGLGSSSGSIPKELFYANQ